VLWDRGRGGGYLSQFMTGSDLERLISPSPHNPAGSKQVNIKILSPHRARTIFMQGVFPRYGK